VPNDYGAQGYHDATVYLTILAEIAQLLGVLFEAAFNGLNSFTLA